RAERKPDTPAGEDVVVELRGLAPEKPAESHPQGAERGEDHPAGSGIENGRVDDVHLTATSRLHPATRTDETAAEGMRGATRASAKWYEKRTRFRLPRCVMFSRAPRR